MKKLTFFLCAIFLSWIGFAQGHETFSNLGTYGGYQTETWTGDDGGTWTATDARTDQTINDKAITVRNGHLESPSLSGGIGDLTLTTKRVFSGGSGDLTVYINGNQVGTIAYDGTEQTHTLPGINVSGDITIKIETPGNSDRIAMDDLIWTGYADTNGGDNNDCDLSRNVTFDNFTYTGQAYTDGDFTDQDGITWTYNKARGDISIDGSSITLGRNHTPDARLTSNSICGGIGSLTFSYQKAFSTAVNLYIKVNGTPVDTVTSDNDDVHTETVEVNESGDFTLEFFNPDGGQVVIDNIEWTAYDSGETPPPALADCSVRLFDGDNFDYTDDWTDVSEGEYANLNSINGDNWTGEADSFIVGDSATVTIYAEPNFAGDSQTFEAGSYNLDNLQPASMKIVCGQDNNPGENCTTASQRDVTFANFTYTGSSYKEEGDFTDQDGITWTYNKARGDKHIDDNSITLQNQDGANLISDSICDGIGQLRFDYMQPFTNAVELEVWVNGDKITTVTTTSDEKNEVKFSGVIDVDVQGSFTLKFKNVGNQCTIDNIEWTAYGESFPAVCLPPSNLEATADGSHTANLSWDGNASSYKVVYGEGASFDPDSEGTTLTPNPTETSASLTNLNPDTDYQVYVKSLCDSDESDWAHTSFHTYPPDIQNPDGWETFANYPETGNSYKNGTFEGQDGSTWSYHKTSGSKHINDESATLSKSADQAYVASGTLHNGIDSLSFLYRQAFSNDVDLSVYIITDEETIPLAHATSDNENGVLKRYLATGIDVSGDFKIKLFDEEGNQVTVDDIKWTNNGTPEATLSLTAPADQTVECVADIVPNIAGANATTTCPDDAVNITAGNAVLVSGDNNCDGAQYTITYTAIDQCADTVTAVQTFTLANDGPSITAPADQTVTNVSDIQANTAAANYTTSCGIDGTVTAADPEQTGNDTYVITYTVTDNCGRMATADQTWTVESEPFYITVAETHNAYNGSDVSYTSTAPNPNGDYTGVNTYVFELIPGQEVEFNLETSTPGNINIWIDRNGNGQIDGSSEMIYHSTSANTAFSGSYTLSPNAVPGYYLVKIKGMSEEGAQNEILKTMAHVVSPSNPDLSVGNEAFHNFNFYPNPVGHHLSLRAETPIEKVSLFNMLGQRVLHITPNTLQTNLDMSNLQSGIYVLHVTLNGHSKAFKVVKK